MDAMFRHHLQELLGGVGGESFDLANDGSLLKQEIRLLKM
jgi:hypothetical protein